MRKELEPLVGQQHVFVGTIKEISHAKQQKNTTTILLTNICLNKDNSFVTNHAWITPRQYFKSATFQINDSLIFKGTIEEYGKINLRSNNLVKHDYSINDFELMEYKKSPERMKKDNNRKQNRTIKTPEQIAEERKQINMRIAIADIARIKARKEQQEYEKQRTQAKKERQESQKRKKEYNDMMMAIIKKKMDADIELTEEEIRIKRNVTSRSSYKKMQKLECLAV